MSKLLFLLLIQCIAANVYASIDSCAGFDVKAGILDKGKDGYYYVSRETKIIPMITIENNPNFRFGISIKSKNDSNFRIRATVTIPKTTNLNFDRDIDPKVNNELITINFPESDAPGESVLENYFNNGDSLGLYIFKIYINNTYCNTIDFTAVRDNNS